MPADLRSTLVLLAFVAVLAVGIWTLRDDPWA